MHIRLYKNSFHRFLPYMSLPIIWVQPSISTGRHAIRWDASTPTAATRPKCHVCSNQPPFWCRFIRTDIVTVHGHLLLQAVAGHRLRIKVAIYEDEDGCMTGIGPMALCPKVADIPTIKGTMCRHVTVQDTDQESSPLSYRCHKRDTSSCHNLHVMMCHIKRKHRNSFNCQQRHHDNVIKFINSVYRHAMTSS